jgi:hypothetical protein
MHSKKKSRIVLQNRDGQRVNDSSRPHVCHRTVLETT